MFQFPPVLTTKWRGTRFPKHPADGEFWVGDVMMGDHRKSQSDTKPCPIAEYLLDRYADALSAFHGSYGSLADEIGLAFQVLIEARQRYAEHIRRHACRAGLDEPAADRTNYIS